MDLSEFSGTGFKILVALLSRSDSLLILSKFGEVMGWESDFSNEPCSIDYGLSFKICEAGLVKSEKSMGFL